MPMPSSHRVAVDTSKDKVNILGGKSVAVRNKGSQSCYLGDNGVTSDNGFELAAGEVLSMTLDPGDELWAICAAGQSTTLHVLETDV